MRRLRLSSGRTPIAAAPIAAPAPLAALAALVALVTVAAGCTTSSPSAAKGDAPTTPAASSASSTTGPTVAPPSTTTATNAPTTTAPTTTTPPSTTTTTLAPGSFVGTVATVTAADIASSWRSGCPVPPSQLRMLHMSYWGFDNQAHVGAMVVNAAVTGDVEKVFSQLFAQHFPIRQMRPVDAYNGSDPASMNADNTSGFNCRYAVGSSPPQWSAHAFGEAIDVNTVENPYLEGGTVMPPAGATFLDRANVRPGMAVAGGPLVQAFASVGWFWGGRWSAPDYQHFSKSGG